MSEQAVILHVRPESATDGGVSRSLTERLDRPVLTASSPEGALDALADADVGAVLCDHAPEDGLDGLAVLEAIRADRPALPVVLCTDQPDGLVAAEATRLGVTEYVPRSDTDPTERLRARLADTDPSPRPGSLSASYETIAGSVSTAVITIDADSNIAYANEAATELTGYDRDWLVGRSFTALMPDGMQQPHLDSVGDYLETGERSTDWEYLEFPILTADGARLTVAVSFDDFTHDGQWFCTGIVRDISERKSRERELERNNESLQELTQLAADDSLDDDEIIDRVLELGAERLDLSLGYLSRIDGSDYEVVSVIGDHDVIQAGVETDLANTYCRRIVDGPDRYGVTDAAAEGWEDDMAYQMSGIACYLGGKVVVDGELYGTLCFADETPRSEPFSESEQTFTQLLAEWTSRELERRQRNTDLERYEDVIEAVDDGIYALDETGHFQLVNDAMTELTGYDADELLGAHTSFIKDDEVVDRAESIVRSMIFDEREGNEETFDLEILRADGSSFPAEDHMALMWDDAGEWFEGTAGIIRDITAQKERDQRLSGLLETTRSLMQAHTAEAVAETVVAAAESELGFDLNLVRLYDEDTETLAPVAGTSGMPDRPMYDADEAFPGEAYQRGETVRVDDFDDVENYDSRKANAAMYVPLDDHGVLSVATYDQESFSDADVSVAEILASNAAAALDRVEREQDLLRYETVMENVRDMVYVLDEEGRFQLVTEPLADWLGYERAELHGRHPRAVLDEESVDAFDERIRDRRGTGEDATIRMETTLYTADGEERPVEIEVSLIDEAGFRGTAGVVRDRTELEQTREELRDERDRFSYLFNNLPDAVVETEFTDDSPLVRSVNPAFTDVFGLDRPTVIDGDLNEYIVPPDDDARREADRLDEQGAEGEPVQAEIRRRTADGFRDFLFRGVPYRHEDGRVWSFGIYTDITEQKERERRLEVLNRVLRHNLRNDLTVVLGLADELHDRTDDATHRDLLERLQAKAEQIASLSDRARDIERSVRRDDADTTPLDVTEVVESVAERYATQYGTTIARSVPATRVEAADGRLGRVLGELLENSLEHAGEAPTVSVAVDPSPETVSVTVTDDGPGIPDHELDVLTGSEPITQLSHGSGLGLWLVIWVTESYGGTVRFENTAGGASVTLTLPRTDI